MKTKKPKDTPLGVEIKDDQVVIRYGISTEAFCALKKNGGPLPENYRISDEHQFAKDVIHELTRQDEIGASILTNALDKAIEQAADQGSTAVYQLKRKAREL